MKLLYKPFGFLLAVLAGLLGRKAFDYVWTRVDDEEPPEATTEEVSWRRVLAVAAVQGVIFKVTRAAVDRYGAIGWRHLTGTWPGEKRPDPE
jgi:Protein of unknown function (DUF4235)